MTVLDDLIVALHEYPDDHIQLTIVDFDGPGDVINPHETWSFRVRVANNGVLDITNVRLHVAASSNVIRITNSDIAGNPINWRTSILVGSMSIPAGSRATTRTIYMHATAPTSRTELFEIHLSGWDASLDHILRDLTGHDSGARTAMTREVQGT